MGNCYRPPSAFFRAPAWALPALGFILSGVTLPSFAAIRPETVFLADVKKKNSYLSDGLVVGGDYSVDDVTVKNIRRAPNQNFERIVIDLEANREGESLALPRPPYFQVNFPGDEKKLIVTLWGNPKLSFDPKKVTAAFKKSQFVQDIALLPRLEQDSWTLALALKTNCAIEVFELTHPVRIILDIRPKKL